MEAGLDENRIDEGSLTGKVLHTLETVTEQANYGDANREQPFGVALRSVP